ncbi:MAG: PPOX class F420-dependent oxidoreductase [Candidatus Bathyarchaeia archaeon]
MTQFEGQRYIALETFKRNGEGVRTPIWFVEESGKLYVWTSATSGKAKRIRNNPRVRFASSSVRGKPKDEWVEGEAQTLNPNDSTRPTELIRRKYGVQFWFANHLHGRDRVIIKLEATDRT